jgi:hypothetical protein
MNAPNTIGYDVKQRVFFVHCEPHIALRIKRVFSKIDKTSHGVLYISDSAENARDLEWFMSRYPLKVHQSAEEHLRRRSEEFKEREALIDKLLSRQLEPRAFDVVIPGRDYQKVAAQLVLTTGGLLVADDVGLGKTMIAILMMTDPATRPALVVTLAGTMPKQWEEEIRKFAPQLRTHVIKSGTPYDLTQTVKRNGQLRFAEPTPDVIIMNYHKLAGWAGTLSKIVKSITFDECQELRRRGDHRAKSAKYAAAEHIAHAAKYRLGLSVGPDSFLCLRGGPFGAGWFGGIGEAFEIVLPQSTALFEGGYTILPIQHLNVDSRGWTDGHSFQWKPVKSFIRHTCDKPVRAVQVRGSRLIVTDDHSLFRIVADQLEAVRSDELTQKDILPFDNGSDWLKGAEGERIIDIPEIMPASKKTQVQVEIAGKTRTDFGLKAWQWQNLMRERTLGSRLSLDLFLKYRKSLPEPTGMYFSATRGKARVVGLPEIRLSEWAYVLGFFLGDGWLNKDSKGFWTSVGFSIDRPTYAKVRAALRGIGKTPLRIKERKKTKEMLEIKCENKFFAQILAVTFVGAKKCWEKEIPAEWITTWPQAAREQLLEGLLDSDGHADSPVTSVYTTTSLRLARSVQLLLTSLGKSSSLYHRNPERGGRVPKKDGTIRRIQGKRVGHTVMWCEEENTSRRGLAASYKPGPAWNAGKVWKRDACASPPYIYDLEMVGHPSFVVEGILAHNSATPIFNFGGEFFNVVNCLSPGSLGTAVEFHREWCTTDYDKPKIKDPKAFGTYLRSTGIMLRRTRAEVGRELPPLIKIPHYVDADPAALATVSRSCAELARLILAQGEAFKGQKMQASEELSNKLRQATGIAKCMAPGTLVLKFDGSIEKVENLKQNDLLMGPDSKPRRILSTSQGQGDMYEVSSTSKRPLFDAYTVNGDHVLALKHSGAIRYSDRGLFGPYVVGDHIEISVHEYLKKSTHFKRLLKGYKTGVEFPDNNLPLDPYFLGLWLGDGTSRSAAITTADQEIRDYVYGNGLECLPVRVERKKSSKRTQRNSPICSAIKIKPVGQGDYYGFTLEGDGLFLLSDFTVTHNSPFVADFVKLLLESEKNIVLFGWHREVYRIWGEALADFSPVMFTGSESVTQKQESLDKFKSGKSRVLMMSLRAGAGVDGLQGVCRTVVFGELDWSAGVHEQNAGRVHRDGQPDSVAAYYLISNYGADPVMVDVLGIKKAQLEGVRDPEASLVEKLDVTPGDHIKRLAEHYLNQVSQ